MTDLKMLIFSKIQTKIEFFAKKSSKYRNFTWFFAYKEGKLCFYHVLQVLGPYHADIFQNGDLKYFQVATIPPYPRTLTTYPTPVLGGTPRFFHQNDRKGCKRDYFDARGYFVLRFGAIGEKPLGGW